MRFLMLNPISDLLFEISIGEIKIDYFEFFFKLKTGELRRKTRHFQIRKKFKIGKIIHEKIAS